MDVREPTAEQLATELRAVERAAKILRCDGFRKLGKFDRIDFALERARRIVFWVEVKSRNCPSSQYPDLILSVAKMDALVRMQRTTGTPSVLLAAWTDCLGILYFPVVATFFDIGGRTDRGLEKDIEPVAHFPVSAFRLCKWES